MNKEKTVVVIRCITYNHIDYIQQCLEGFVMQQTTFPFVAIVHDDASTDGTAKIVSEYAEKYPDIIIPIIESENQWSKHDGSLKRIMDCACEESGAKYIAECEGDDYWTDPLKLQKQVDFLESHPDYSLCFHRAEVQNETNINVSLHSDCVTNREYFANDFLSDWIVPTASIIYRKDIVERVVVKHQDWLTRGDMNLVLKCLMAGRAWGMSDAMCVYRMQMGGASKNPELLKKEIYKLPNYFKCLYINYQSLDKEGVLRSSIAKAYYSRSRVAKSLLNKVNDVLLSFVWSPKVLIGKVKQGVHNLLRRQWREVKRDTKAILEYHKMDKMNLDRKIRIFNSAAYSLENFTKSIKNKSDHWLCQFVRQCDLPLKDGDLSIFGIHGRKVVINMNRSKYKIFFTIENVHAAESYWPRFGDNLINDKRINLSLGFDYIENEKYLRFPFWLMCFLQPDDTIETIRGKIETINNARKEAWKKKKACTLICRNDYYGDRAYFADQVEQVLDVRYGGAFRHNDDELVEKYGNNKLSYIQQFMFSLCPENTNSNGYVTEKLFDAFKAGCLPIYWGSDNMPEPDIINPDAILFLKLNDDNSETLSKIKRLQEDEEYCRTFAEQPVFLEGAEYRVYQYLEDLKTKIKSIVR